MTGANKTLKQAKTHRQQIYIWDEKTLIHTQTYNISRQIELVMQQKKNRDSKFPNSITDYKTKLHTRINTQNQKLKIRQNKNNGF